jgi:hypothetical protein
MVEYSARVSPRYGFPVQRRMHVGGGVVAQKGLRYGLQKKGGCHGSKKDGKRVFMNEKKEVNWCFGCGRGLGRQL